MSLCNSDPVLNIRSKLTLNPTYDEIPLYLNMLLSGNLHKKEIIFSIQVKVEKALFRVVGMYCTTCKPIVERQLKDEEAVKKIDIDYMTDSVIVEFDPSIITKEEIKNRLEKSGYKFVRTAGK
jgi:copper chaperone